MLHELPEFDYMNAESINEATFALKELGNKAAIIAGGTDLLSRMKRRVKGPTLPAPKTLINIKSIPGMQELKRDRDGSLRIGAAVTLSKLGRTEQGSPYLELLAQAANSVATLQIRNMATVGGNLCQKYWCWYYRNPDISCYKKGGKLCPAVAGQNGNFFAVMNLGVCVSSHPSDLAPALLALDAKVKLDRYGSSRTVPLQEFFVGPREQRDNILDREMITEILVPNHRKGTAGHFLKSRLRNTEDFAEVNVAVIVQRNNGTCQDVRIGFGAIAPTPFRATEAERFLSGKPINQETAEQAAQIALKDAHPLRMNKYKVTIARSLLREVLQIAWRKSGEG